MAALIETASQNCVKRLEFDEVIVEFYENANRMAALNYVSDEFVGGEIPGVPKRPNAPPIKLNQDYDAWTAAQPGPIFEKE